MIHMLIALMIANTIVTLILVRLTYKLHLERDDLKDEIEVLGVALSVSRDTLKTMTDKYEELSTAYEQQLFIDPFTPISARRLGKTDGTEA